MQSYRQLIERTRLLEKDRNISLDFTDKKIVDSWIKNNAEKITKEVINEHVKKLFK